MLLPYWAETRLANNGPKSAPDIGMLDMGFILRSVFWLGLAFLVIQPQGMDLPGAAQQLGTSAMETSRAAARDGIDQIICESLECTGAKFVAQTALAAPSPPTSIVDSVSDAPHPAPAPRRIS